MRFANVLAILIPALLPACWDNNPCDPGQVVVYTQCAWPPETNAQDTSDTASDPWGVACTPTEAETSVDANETASQSDSNDASDAASDGASSADSGPCYGNAPICAPSPLNYCTNIDCSQGEANYGICPAGWTCVPASNGLPSGCVK
jgi:hypothetical protein